MSLPVLTRAAMRAWEQASWAAGARATEVIQMVGIRLAQWLQGHSNPDDSILVLAGPGHNGDDARAAIPVLADRRVELISVRDPSAAFARVARALQTRHRWVVDGLFGIGLHRPLDGAWLQLVQLLNDSSQPVVAVDVPSGLDADRGIPLGSAVRSVHTLTVGAPKTGLLLEKATAWVGRLAVLEDVGLIAPPAPAAEEQHWLQRSDFESYPTARESNTHKGDHGHLVVVAGSPGYHGAAVLAARGALSMRPGLVTVVTLPSSLDPVASQLAAPMVRPWTGPNSVPAKAGAFLVGPGLAAPEAAALREQVAQWWISGAVPMVVDATALDWIPPGAFGTDQPRIITPHPGEAARMLGCDAASIQSDRPAALRALSRKFGDCWVVLKGRHTLVGKSNGPIALNSTGSDSLAQGGTGDVLAGMLGGMLAQNALTREKAHSSANLRPSVSFGPVQTLSAYAAYEHGRRADILDQQSKSWNAESLATPKVA